MTQDTVRALPDYAQFVQNFDPKQIEAQFSGSFEHGINACVEVCDRHADSGRIALRWVGADGSYQEYSFAELKALSARFANLLTRLGVKPGDRVSAMLPRIPEMMVVLLGTLRAGAVYQPLFTAFGPKAIDYRVSSSAAKLIVTDSNNRPKLDDSAQWPQIITIDRKGQGVPEGDIDFQSALDAESDEFEPVMSKGDDPFLMLFTSGTTGLPKGVAVPNMALSAFYVYMRYAIDLREDDVFWNIADPGWAYGLYYSALGPLLLGQTTLFHDAPFSVAGTAALIRQYGVTNLAGAPTAYRMMMAAPKEEVAPIKGRLRVVNSAGEPLNPEVIRWFRDEIGCPVYDQYGQTELGMVVCNHHALSHAVHPGSAGFAMPGYTAVVLDDHHQILPPGKPGTLALDRSRSPLFFFQGYWQKDTPSFVGPYYLTGDTVELNEDGSISFVGRDSDLITSAGYRIGPFDVESALIEHPAVAETAVIGKPDAERTEIVKAFVVLKPGYSPGDELIESMQQLVRSRLAAHAYPREIEFVAELPKTPSGKIQRFLLRKQEADKQA